MAEVEAPTASPEVAAADATSEAVVLEAVAEEVAGPEENPVALSDHKRKHEDLEVEEGALGKPKEEAAAEVPSLGPEAEPVGEPDGVQEAIKKAKEFAARLSEDASPADGKRPRLDGEVDGSAADGGQQVQKLEIPEIGNGHLPTTEKPLPTSTENFQENTALVPQLGNIPSGQQPTFEGQSSSRKIEVPNNKVGVLIGKAGETIRFLQYNSGAKIQITRDVDADPQSSTRPVELIGTLESIDKAEQLIKDVIAEADAGGSPALVARGFGTAQPGAEQLQIQVPNEKVGLIIGKGGETIKNLQTRSGARIQLIPQHLPEGDLSKERTVRITGNKKQIDAATEMIKEVMNQVPGRPSLLSGGYGQQMYRPRGPTGQPQWGPRAMPPAQPTPAYDNQQRGMYPSQATQYPPQTYAGYPQQAPPRGGWEQRPGAPIQTPSQMGGYDYYGQGGHPADTQPPATAGAGAGAPAPAPMNYNYGSSQAPGYGQPASYPQSAPHGYDEPKYDSQAPSQQVYGQQPVSSQPGVYPQPGGAPQAGYTQQQPYNRPAYGGVPPQGQPQSYGQPRPTQPGDAMYQGTVPSSYGSMPPSQQQPYPYGSGAPPQQAPGGYTQPYGPTSAGSADGYAQPSAGYPQQGGQAATGYGQAALPAPTYPQGGQPGSYGQYPPSQPSYGEQPVPNNASYGYQGGPAAADTGYGNASGYGGPPPAGSQAGYAQPPANPSGYEQTMPPQQGYVKSVSPQQGYAQYDSSQVYGHH